MGVLRKNSKVAEASSVTYEAFIRRIKEELELQGIDQQELARRLGVSSGRISQALSSPNPTLTSMAAIANALGFSLRLSLRKRKRKN